MTSHTNDSISTDLKKAEQSIFYYSSWVTLLGSLVGQLFIVILLFSTFKDADNKLVQVVNSFYSTYDPTQTDPTWQVASQHWGLPSGAITNPTVNTYSPYYTDEIITPMTECMYSAQIGSSVCKNNTLNDYYKCINNNFAASLTTCNGLGNTRQFLYPIRQEYAECIWKKVGSNKANNLTVLSRCMDITFWPIYEVIQDVDSKYFLGSYNWAHLVLIGFFLYANMLMYTSSPIYNDSKIKLSNFKPSAASEENSLFVRGSIAQVLVCFAILLFVFIIQVTLFSGNSPLWFDNYGFPSSTSTLILVLTFTVGIVIYYILEIAEFYQATSPTMFKQDYALVAPTDNTNFMANIPVAFQMQAPNLGYYASKERSGTLSGSDRNGALFGPQLLKTWADANVTNILFFIGVIGCTMQVNVIEIYNVFSLLIVLRLLDMTFARMNFTSNFPEEVFRVSLRFASLLTTIFICITLWNTNKVSSESGILTAISVLCLFIPETLKFIYEIFIQMINKDGDYSLISYNMYFYQFICAWNIVFEVIFLIVIFWGNDAYGNLSFLKNKHQNLIVWFNI